MTNEQVMKIAVETMLKEAKLVAWKKGFCAGLITCGVYSLYKAYRKGECKITIESKDKNE